MIILLIKIFSTQWQETEEKKHLDQSMKKPPNLDGELRKKINNGWRSDINGKIVNEKPLDSRDIQGWKLMLYD